MAEKSPSRLIAAIWDTLEQLYFEISEMHRVYRDRDEIVGVFLPSQLERAYTATLYVMVNIVKGVGVHLHPGQPGLIFPSLWDVRQKAAVANLCVPCAEMAAKPSFHGT